MKYRKFVISLLTIVIVSTMALEVYAEDTRIPIDGGDGSWHGGVNDSGSTVYSYIWDHIVDRHAYKATVWVQDALGNKEEETGQTFAVNEEGEVRVTCPAQYSLFSKNKAGYKNLEIVDLDARQVYLRDTTAPSSFEAEFDIPDPAVK